MSTHNIPFSIPNKKITIKYPKSAAMGFFLGTQDQVRDSSGKRAISVRATEVLLYMQKILPNGGLMSLVHNPGFRYHMETCFHTTFIYGIHILSAAFNIESKGNLHTLL